MLSVSRFHGLVKLLPRGVFDAAVAAHASDKHSKGFRTWDHLMGMLFAQWSGATSLREATNGFNAHAAHHFHLRTREIRRSTLADANGKRDPAVFADIAAALMPNLARRERKEGEMLLTLLDSTSITLKGGHFEGWTAPTQTRRTQGVKLHLQYAPASALPLRASITAANVNDITAVTDWPLHAGMRYVFDKGYCDYGWWQRIADAGSVFVTRFKTNAALKVLQVRAIEPAAVGIVLSDERVEVAIKRSRGGHRNPYSAPLRRIVVARPDHATPLVLATNDLERSALEIAQDYKDRWQIELFFKWIKQHLKIKRFLGESETAVRIQLLTALIAYLLVAISRKASGYTGSMWSYLGLLRASLFQRVQTEVSHHRRHRERRAALAAIQPVLFA